MHYAGSLSHHGAQEVLQRVGLVGLPKAALNAPKITIRRGCSDEIKKHVAACLLSSPGWASGVKVDPSLGPSVNAVHTSGVVFHVQIGNIARAFYDLMKMQALYARGRVRCGILAVPTKAAAKTIGGNLANFDRLRDELDQLFASQISIPLLLAAFE